MSDSGTRTPYEIVRANFTWASCDIVTVKAEFAHLGKPEFVHMFPEEVKTMQTLAVQRLFRTLRFEPSGSADPGTAREALDAALSGSAGIAFVLALLADCIMDDAPWRWATSEGAGMQPDNGIEEVNGSDEDIL